MEEGSSIVEGIRDMYVKHVGREHVCTRDEVHNLGRGCSLDAS